METIRLIIDPPGTGAWNMAVDEVLLQTASEQQQATLRFYQWSPATLSLGYFQKAEDRNLHTESENCNLVRRSSGGGAILHDHELTYSYAFPVKDPRDEEVTRLFDIFHESLIRVLKVFSVEAQLCGKPNIGKDMEKSFLCFQRRSSVDVIVDGQKVCGSAQRRGKGAVLQHGSVLVKQSEFAPQLPGLIDLGAVNLTLDALRKQWFSELSNLLAKGYVNSELTDKEKQLAIAISEQKYSHDAWTLKK